MKTRVTLESVLCRLEAKELEEAAERNQAYHDAMMEGLKIQFDMNNGVAARKGHLITTLRDFGCLLTRIGLSTIAASEEEAADEDA